MTPDFFREQYLFEIDRRDRLDQQAGTILAGLSGLSIALVVMVREFAVLKGLPLHSVALAVLSAAIMTMAVAIVFLVRGFQGSSYKYLDYPDALHAYHGALLTFHGGDRALADAGFTEHLTAQYVRFATLNGKVNDAKARCYYRSKQWLAGSLLPFAAGGAIYLYIVILWAAPA